MESDTIYDLGDVPSAPATPAEPAASARPADPAVPRARPMNRPPPGSRVRAAGANRLPATGAWLPASAAMAVPGAGHFLQGRLRAGLFWLAAVALMATVVAGMWQFLPRLWQAFAVLGLPSEAAVWTLGTVAAAIPLVHSASVLSSRALAPRAAPHPAIACSASALVPGWGQVLNRDLIRAAWFLLGAWVTVAAWTLASGPVQELLVAYRLNLPAPLDLLRSAPARWALIAGIWPLSAYDAGASAVMARRWMR